QFLKIFKFELKNYLANKVYLGVTIFMMAVIIGVLFFPRIAESFKNNSPDNDTKSRIMLIIADSALSEIGGSQLNSAFSSAFPD
ncbi:MAG: hypothetical protein K1V95_06555, partial [Eubacterium sp.]